MRSRPRFQEAAVVRVFGFLALLALAFITMPPLIEVDLFGTEFLSLLVSCLLAGFVVGCLTRSYWALLHLPPIVAVALLLPPVVQSNEFQQVLRGHVPSQATISQGVGVIFMVGIWLLLGFYFLITPGTVAGVWLARKLALLADEQCE